MRVSEFQIDCLRDPRLAPHAASALPAWLWAADAKHVLWANATGAAIFGAGNLAALADRCFDTGQPAAAQIARLAPTLPVSAPPRLERLRGFGAGVGRALTCLCSRLVLADNRAAILVVATEPAGPTLSLPDRAARLIAQAQSAVAIFTADGKLLHASRTALVPLGGLASLTALGGESLATVALAAGHAEGVVNNHAIVLDRIGAGDATLLLAALGERQSTAQASPPTPAAVPQPAPDAPLPAAPPVAASEPPAQPAPPTVPAAATQERRHPLRFVWQMDADGNFSLGPGEFADLVGNCPTEPPGQPWRVIAAALALDPRGEVAEAVSTRDTWSGVEVAWPVTDTGARLPVELSGLPVFDRERRFGGYRGFGVCRNLERITALTRLRRAVNGTEPATTAGNAAPVLSTAAPTLVAPVPRDAAEPPALQIVSPNVVPFRAPAEAKSPSLSPVERRAFRELARKLTQRLKDADHSDVLPQPSEPDEAEPAAEILADAPPLEPPGRSDDDMATERDRDGSASTALAAPTAPEPASEPVTVHDPRPLLERLPLGVLVYRLDALLYANRAFLDWTGYRDLDELSAAGGLDSLFIDGGVEALGEDSERGKPLTVATPNGDTLPVEARLFAVPWNGEPTLVLMLVSAAHDDRQKAAELAGKLAEVEIRELKAIVDTAADGVLVIDRDGKVLSANRRAEALFGRTAAEISEQVFADLFAAESRRSVIDYVDTVSRNAGAIPDGREVTGRAPQGRNLPLFLTIGRIADNGQKVCAVLRDLTHWKRVEEDLINAKRQAERASSAKSEFLAKVSHEIRTPLNAIIGFSEVMMEERFGPIGNERYREYLRDIHQSGGHVVSLLNDLLDLSKIEAGKLELTFVSVNLNELTQQCVAIMQPQANRERIIIRSSLAPTLPQIVADARSVRQIVLNLLSNSIKFTGAGGQVIVSTALNDDGEVALRVRDTGVGMSEQDIATALEPFRQLATSARWGSGGTGLGLPLTKALAEANRARFSISSAPNAGTLVEVVFPATRVLTD